jgi:gluconate:H+ symporter, GntP family
VNLLVALVAVVALILLIARFKVHPFVALVTVSLAMGAAAGMSPGMLVKAFQDGVGATLGSIAVVVGLGTMLGKMMAESGGAARIATTLIAWFGERRVHWAIMVVAFIVGIPVFFQVGFVLLIPLVFTIARRTGTSLLKVGIPLVAGLSVVHGMVPPHPAAMLAVTALGADLGRTIFYAVLVGFPTAALAGPIFAMWVAPRITLPAINPMAAQLAGAAATSTLALPSFSLSLFTILVPVLLMLGASAADLALAAGSTPRTALDFLGNPIVALLLTLLFSFWALGVARGVTGARLLAMANDCLAPTAAILLVIGAGGGFNRVLIESGVGKAIADVAIRAQLPPLIFAWTVAALVRVATGSATVAMTTAAGIVAPIAAATPHASAELLVLATGAGALMLSHVNDAGFWLIKEYFNMTVGQTLKTWTVAESIIGTAGLALTLLLSLVVGGCAPPSQSAARWIDATATLDPATTPVYPGDAPLRFDFLKDMRRGDPLTLSAYTLGAHSGTHIDAPMHFVVDGAPIDRLALDALVGPARVVQIDDSVPAIDAAELSRHQWKGAERVLFRTRNTGRRWMSSAVFHRDFTYIAPDAAQLLADAGVRLVGIDYISAEQFGAPAPRTHRILLGRGTPIVEGLDLSDAPAGDYDLVVLPIKVRGHEGAPARAILRPRG